MDPGASLPRSPAPSAACSGGRGLGGTRSRAGFHQTVRLPRTPPASHRLSCGKARARRNGSPVLIVGATWPSQATASPK